MQLNSATDEDNGQTLELDISDTNGNQIEMGPTTGQAKAMQAEYIIGDDEDDDD